jgi:hypothetical protein
VAAPAETFAKPSSSGTIEGLHLYRADWHAS